MDETGDACFLTRLEQFGEPVDMHGAGVFIEPVLEHADTIDHRIHTLEPACPVVRLVGCEVTRDPVQRRQACPGRTPGPCRGDHLMTARLEYYCDVGADKTGCSGDEKFHSKAPPPDHDQG